MSNLRPYLEDYVKTINHLLANHQDDSIIKAAKQTWGATDPTDPRYLVFVGGSRARSPLPPGDTAGGDAHLPNSIPYLKEYVKTIDDLLANHQDDSIIKAAKQTWGEKDPRYLVFIGGGIL
jgi:hypothetical protein